MTQAWRSKMFHFAGDREKTPAGWMVLLDWRSWSEKSLPSGLVGDKDVLWGAGGPSQGKERMMPMQEGG